MWKRIRPWLGVINIIALIVAVTQAIVFFSGGSRPEEQPLPPDAEQQIQEQQALVVRLGEVQEEWLAKEALLRAQHKDWRKKRDSIDFRSSGPLLRTCVETAEQLLKHEEDRLAVALELQRLVSAPEDKKLIATVIETIMADRERHAVQLEQYRMETKRFGRTMTPNIVSLEAVIEHLAKYDDNDIRTHPFMGDMIRSTYGLLDDGPNVQWWRKWKDTHQELKEDLEIYDATRARLKERLDHMRAILESSYGTTQFRHNHTPPIDRKEGFGMPKTVH